MKKLLLALLVSTPCFADTINLTCDPVTVDTAGLPTVVSAYKFYESSTSGVKGTLKATSTTCDASFTENAVGIHYAVATAANVFGESDPSNETIFVINGKVPAQVQNLKATVK